MIHTGICNGFGFNKNTGPYLVLDAEDISISNWGRTNVALRGTLVHIALIPKKYCIGYYKLLEHRSFPCPRRNVIARKIKNCRSCFYLTGFNPAFYHVKKSSLSAVQRKYNLQPHYVYIAAFGSNLVKVGIACKERLCQRLTEQGVRLAMVVALLPDAYKAREVEKKVQSVLSIPDRVTNKRKIEALVAYNFETTSKVLESLRRKVVNTVLTQGSLPYFYNPNEVYVADNLMVGSVDPVQLSAQQDVLTGYFCAMIGSFLFLKLPEQSLTVVDIHQYLGSMHISVDSS